MYLNGDRLALWDAIDWCGRFQAVLPEWVVDAILAVSNGIKSGHIKDFNEAFGFTPTNPTVRKKDERIRKRMMDVTYAIYYAKRDGCAIDDELYVAVGEQLGLSPRQVKDCYKEGIKRFPKCNWLYPSPGEVVATVNMKVTVPRRTGRSIL